MEALDIGLFFVTPWNDLSICVNISLLLHFYYRFFPLSINILVEMIAIRLFHLMARKSFEPNMSLIQQTP